jgi:hypothetical protein
MCDERGVVELLQETKRRLQSATLGPASPPARVYLAHLARDELDVVSVERFAE